MRGSKDYVLVNVDTAKLDAEWKASDPPGFYVGPGGTENAIHGRYERFQKWLKDNPGTPIEAPLISYNDYDDRGGVSFTNGRHRFAVLRDMGYPRVSVMVPMSQAKTFRTPKFAAYSNASTQVNVPDNIAGKLEQFSKALIPDEDLAGKGREMQAHITLKYGVDEDAEGLRRAVQGVTPFPVTFGKLHVFTPSEASEGTAPIVIEVVGSGLKTLKEKIDAEIGNRPDNFPDYQPHITLAYVKPDVSQKYEGLDGLKGISFMVREVALSRKSETQEVVQLERAMGMHASKSPKLAAEEDPYGKVQNVVTEMMAVLSPGLPRPTIKIVNRAAEPTGGDCHWRYGQDANGQVYADENTTISIQSDMVGNDKLLPRVVAHELAHHEDLLLNERPKVLRMGLDAYKMLQYRGYGHGSGWRAIARRFNAKYGANFVTEKMLIDKNEIVQPRRNVYVLINEFKYGPRGVRLGWQYAFNLSRQAMDYLSKLNWEGGEYRLVQTDDPDFGRGKAKIGQFNGWNLARSKDVEEKLAKLWAEAPNADISKVGAEITDPEEKQHFQTYTEMREARVKEYAAFIELADEQRGAPEHAMLRIQHHPLGAGVYSFVVEHCGDLTHRMNERVAIINGSFGYGSVKEKTEKVLRVLENAYGFEREMQGNMRGNYGVQKDGKLKGKTLDEAIADFKAVSKRYAEAHAALRVYNRPQTLARDAAVSLGNWDFDGARSTLNMLKAMIDAGQEAWIAEASKGAPKGKTGAKFVDNTTYYHGSPSGELRGAAYGLHIGTFQAAKDALTARIGYPAQGEWDGTREYGKTLLMGKKSLAKHGIFPTGYSAGGQGTPLPDEDFYPGDWANKAKFSDGTQVAPTMKPDIFPVKIVGDMVNTPNDPRQDFKANSIMRGQITRGQARRGVYYKNVSEDEGSISAVVPDGSFIQKVGSKIAGAMWDKVKEFKNGKMLFYKDTVTIQVTPDSDVNNFSVEVRLWDTEGKMQDGSKGHAHVTHYPKKFVGYDPDLSRIGMLPITEDHSIVIPEAVWKDPNYPVKAPFTREQKEEAATKEYAYYMANYPWNKKANSKPYAEWTQEEKNRDWAERNKLPIENNRVRLYHATPSATAAIIDREGLRKGSFLAQDGATAMQQAGRDRGLKARGLVLYEAWVPLGTFHGSTWAQTIPDLTPEQLSLRRVNSKKTAAADAWEQLKQDWRAGIVYHGTTVDIARIIAKDGFRGLEFIEILNEVLSKYGKTIDQIPRKRQKALESLERSYSMEHHLVSTTPAGEVATRFAGQGGEVAAQIEAYVTGKWSTRDVKNSRISGEPAVVVARIKNFQGSHHQEQVENVIKGWERLMSEPSKVTNLSYTKEEAVQHSWQQYTNFLCKPEDLEYLGTLVGSDLEKLKQGPFLMTFDKSSSHKTPPLSDTRYDSGDYGEGLENNGYANIPERTHGVEGLPALETLIPEEFE